MNFGIKKQVLLTGAGFTYRVGGFLGEQFRIRLFNDSELKKQPNVFSQISREGADYESIYCEVTEHSPMEKEAIIEGYDRAYLELDRSICRTCHPAISP